MIRPALVSPIAAEGPADPRADGIIRPAGARKDMELVLEELQLQIAATQERLVAAFEADDPHEVVQHRARLLDLVDMAARHGVDVRSCVNRTLL